MVAESAAGDVPSGRSQGRFGRPPRELAGEVEQRILDAAGKVFLEHGFSGASVDEIADVARAGKPTIYARFPGKKALFAAVIERLIRRNTGLEPVASAGPTIEEQLGALASEMLRRILAPEAIGMMRAVVAEERRFPELATHLSRMGRERQAGAVTRVLTEIAASGRTAALPAFAPERLPDTARLFLDLAILPMLMRGLFGEDLAALQAEIGPHVARAVENFLAACKVGEAMRPEAGAI